MLFFDKASQLADRAPPIPAGDEPGASGGQHRFWHDLERFGDNVALKGEAGESVSYVDLARMADNAGFACGARRLVVMEIDNSIPAVAAYLGALRAGHAIILTAPGNIRDLDLLVETYRPDLMVSHSDGLIEADAGPNTGLHPDLAVMLSTSGSTGSPKLVRLSDANLDANARSIAAYLGICPRDCAITTLPPYYSYGLSVLHSRLASGASIALTNRSVTDPEFLRIAGRCEATTLAGVPYTYELLLASGLLDDLPPSMRLLTQAGGRLAPELVERVRVAAEARNLRFFVMYGQTEATARMAYVPPEQLARYPDCIGQPIPGGSFELVDPQTGAPADKAGELVYRGPNVMMGYASDRGDLARGRDIDRLVTGDLAEMVRPGMFRITGRKRRFIKLFGRRIALDQAEAEAARIGWSTVATGDDERLVLAVEGDRDPAPLAAYFADHYKLPPKCVVALRLPVIPRLASGKPDYRSILAGVSGDGPASPDGDPMATYAAVLAQAARTDAVGDDATFREFGGDSLMYVEAIMALDEAFGTAPVGWESMPLGTLRKMSAATVPDPAAAQPRIQDFGFIPAMRTVAILLVLAPHAKSALTSDDGILNYLHFRHVNAIFVFIAGFLFQKLISSFSYKNYINNKIKYIALPYVLISIPAILVYLFELKDRAKLDAPGFIHGDFMLTVYMILTGTHLGPLWFMPMIFLIYLSSPILKAIDDRPQAYWAVFLLFLLAMYVGRPPLDNNPFQAFVFYLPAYVLGMAVSHYHRRWLPVLAGSWPLFLVPAVVLSVLPPDLQPVDPLMMVAKVCLGLGILGLLARYSARIPGNFRFIGDLSFGIYLVHGYFASAISLTAARFGWDLEGLPAFLFVYAIILSLSVATVLLVKRIFATQSRLIIGA
ncbi:AMP-binding protein [Novosphingobium sp. ZN18A2]|uniref:AMP-binding protein n=1 Tax=Novosphingobium sp. ZN18A2 TaxID=3079861 RepID=UPI0030CFD5E7